MKILFDQGTPVPLRRYLDDHSVDTAFERGWQTLENGQLLSAAENQNYEILVTTDQNLRYQQNLESRRIAIIVIRSTSWPRIQNHIAKIKDAIDSASSGNFIEISID
jgi:predicted nuclease of predicted toxin-antitoxin system